MDSSNVVKIQLRMFRFFGLLPDEDSSGPYKLWGLLIFLWSGLILVCCQAISVFYVETTNQMVEELLLLCTTTTVSMKLALFYFHRGNLPNMLDILKKLDKRVLNDDSVRTMIDIFRSCHRTSMFYFVPYHALLVSLIFQCATLERSERTWKSTTLIPNEFAQRPIVFYSVLVTEGIGNALNCTLAFAIDTYCVLWITLLAGHIEALSMQLAQYGTSEEKAKTQAGKLRLLKYLTHFNLIDDYAKELNSHLSLMFFVQVSVSAPVLCTCAYQFSQAQTLTSTQLMFLITYSVGMTMQIFIPNYFATNVVENSGLLPDKTFSSNWYELESVEKKAVLMFMTRVIRPIAICAGNIFKMNIYTFSKIAKYAYSLLAVLKST